MGIHREGRLSLFKWHSSSRDSQHRGTCRLWHTEAHMPTCCRQLPLSRPWANRQLLPARRHLQLCGPWVRQQQLPARRHLQLMTSGWMDCPFGTGWCPPLHQQFGVATTTTTSTSISGRAWVLLLLVAGGTPWGRPLLRSSP